MISDAELRAVAASGRRYSSVGIDENQHILWGADDPDAGGPGGANHSCDSNLSMLDARTVGARRDVAAGEELTLDYALFSVAPEWRMECHCESTLCRGVVTGIDWRFARAPGALCRPFLALYQRAHCEAASGVVR